MPKRELILAGFGVKLRSESGRLVVEREGNVEAELPAGDVDGVYVLTSAASVTAQAVLSLAAAGGLLAFFDAHGTPQAMLVPLAGWEDAALRVEQIDAARSPHGLAIARAFLLGKLGNQSANLRYFAKSRTDTQPEVFRELRHLADRIDQAATELPSAAESSGHDLRGQLMAAEAGAAQHYWHGLRLVLPPELGFDAREHHGAADPVNASLNYGYGILYSKVFAKLVRAGLDPYVGFLHAIGDGRASLLYDFVEEFRQYFVDRPVLGWLIKGGRPELKDGLLVRESRAKLASLVLERLNSRVPYGGREIPAEEVIECEARELARDIRGQERHKPYIWPW